MTDDNNILVVEGYKFSSTKDSDLAKREVKKVAYLNKNIGSLSPDKVLDLYNRTIDDKVFQTPIGWSYLQTLREWLLQADYSEEEVQPIPLYCVFARSIDEEVPRSRQRIATTKKKEKVTYRANYLTSLVVNIILCILVAAMIILAKNSNTPNIVNYRECIIDQYSSWEDSLTERERAVREKENELGIKDDTDSKTNKNIGETGTEEKGGTAEESSEK